MKTYYPFQTLVLTIFRPMSRSAERLAQVIRNINAL